MGRARLPEVRSCSFDLVMTVLTVGLWWIIPAMRYHFKRR